MRNLLILAILIVVVGIVLFLAGCVNPLIPPSENQTQNATPGNATTDEEIIVAPFSAKEGLANASAMISKITSNASLVGIFGECGSDGTSSSWEYSFDSYGMKKGYAAAIPSASSAYPREKSFSTKRGLPSQYIDSNDAVTICKISGECTLEMENGIVVWTVISGSDVCQVDASNSAVIG